MGCLYQDIKSKIKRCKYLWFFNISLVDNVHVTMLLPSNQIWEDTNWRTRDRLVYQRNVFEHQPMIIVLEINHAFVYNYVQPVGAKNE